MEDSLCDSEAMRRFVQVDLDHIPDETTLCKFRHFLETHDLTASLLRLTTQYLAERALLVRGPQRGGNPRGGPRFADAGGLLPRRGTGALWR